MIDWRLAYAKKWLINFYLTRTFPPGKPKFPVIDLNTFDYPKQLLDFIGPKSWLLFNLLNLKEERLDWLQAPVSFWEKMFGYRRVKIIVRSLEVVNDCAEWAIKLITDYKEATASVEEQEFLLQVVEDYRKKLMLLKSLAYLSVNVFCLPIQM